MVVAVNGFPLIGDDRAPDAAATGPLPAVERMVAWCHVGPPRALVTGVQVTEEPPVGEPGFRVG